MQGGFGRPVSFGANEIDPLAELVAAMRLELGPTIWSHPMFKRAALIFLASFWALPSHAQVAPYQEGVHYQRIQPAQVTTAAAGKVEVIEVFSYACHACDAAQPHVDRWKKTMSPNVQFSYLPAVFHPSWEPFARAYYAANALGIFDKTHQPTFDAKFRGGKAFQSVDDIAALYATHGSSVDEIKKTMTSFAVQTKLDRGIQQTVAYGIERTPTFVINGKWRVSAGDAIKSYDQMFEVVNYLIGREAGAAKP